jgi:hypothetical protein
MIKSTKIVAVDSKGGRRSRTGSFVSMGVTDREAIDCQDYFLDLADGEEPAGKVKKIELVIYYEDDMKIHDEEAEIEETIVDGVKTLEDVIIDQDEEMQGHRHDIEMTGTSEPSIQVEGTGFPKENEHLPPNQRDLHLYGKKYDDDGNLIPKSQIL